jgi:hypothetical protein
MLQQVDSFKSVTETNFIYQLAFNNNILYPEHKATSARVFTDFDLVPGFNITDVYQFFKGSDNDYREVGFGVTLNGFPIAVRYDDIDIIYDFPVQYGNVDSSTSGFSISIPDLGSASSQVTRNSTVDGYGTLMTPYGEFQTLRMKTFITRRDSVFIDTAGQGVPVYREFTEYAWLGKDFGLPLLKVTEEGLLVTVSYIDSVRTSFSDIGEQQAQDYNLVIFPNPCKDYLSVHYELKDVEDLRLSIISLYGTEVYKVVLNNQSPGLYNRIININAEGIVPGVYLLRFETRNIRYTRRVVVQ